MNKFKNIVKNLLEKELWASECELIQLIQQTDRDGHTVWAKQAPLKLKCIKKESKKVTENGKFLHFTEFLIASDAVSHLDLNTKDFRIKYSNKEYNVEEILSMGTLNNEDSLIKFIVRR